MKHGVRVLSAAVLLVACVTLAGADDVKFRTVPAQETGIKPILEKWQADELARHGGEKPSHWWWPWGLTAIDYDRDGDLDLVPTHHGSPGGLVLRNQLVETGRLTFTNATEALGLVGRELPGAIGRRAVVFDFNGDGWLDLTGIRSPHYLNREGKGFEKFGKGANSLHPKEVADVNGDGYPDLVMQGGREAWVFVPDPVAFKTVTLPEPAILAGVPADLRTMLAEKKKEKRNRFLSILYDVDHDLDGDGIKDVIITGSGAYGAEIFGRYLLADKDGKLVDATAAMGLPQEGAPILVTDLTGDGALDVVVAVGKSAGLYVNDGHGKFSVKDGLLKKFLEQGGPYLLRAWTVDLDNDRDLDLVVSNPRYGNEQVYQNDGQGVFKQVLRAGGWDSDPVVICDINDDGRTDLVIGGPGHHDSTEITVYLNETPNAGGFVKLHPRMPAPNFYAVGTLVEAFLPGDAAKPGARPYFAEKAHADGTPVQVGLGDAKTVDLRVTFPGGKPIVLANVAAGGRFEITPDGAIKEKK
ncbi:MAG TPA: VCBS repeat-containing protein [Planctomycetota bacterium]|nr:VCBS repeat-containing protein [Planctomycetota bacterium]